MRATSKAAARVEDAEKQLKDANATIQRGERLRGIAVNYLNEANLEYSRAMRRSQPCQVCGVEADEYCLIDGYLHPTITHTARVLA